MTAKLRVCVHCGHSKENHADALFNPVMCWKCGCQSFEDMKPQQLEGVNPDAPSNFEQKALSMKMSASASGEGKLTAKELKDNLNLIPDHAEVDVSISTDPRDGVTIWSMQAEWNQDRLPQVKLHRQPNTQFGDH